jgi:hypothetical protein
MLNKESKIHPCFQCYFYGTMKFFPWNYELQLGSLELANSCESSLNMFHKLIFSLKFSPTSTT